MKEKLLTLEEIAQFLRVSTNTITGWVARGEIPAKKQGDEYRFSSAEIEKWLHDRFSFEQNGRVNSIDIASMLSTDRILFFEHSRKEDALVALAENLSTAKQITSRTELIEGILLREEMMSTAIGKGIAIPHIRLASITDLVVSVGISRVDITGFNALDELPVRILIMIAAASTQHALYLQTLSHFSARLKQDALRHALLEVSCANEVYRLLVEAYGA